MDRSTSLWLGMAVFGLLGASALYSCVPHIEQDIAVRVKSVVSDADWLQVEVDGQEVILKGSAPDAVAKANVLGGIESLWGVTRVHDLMDTATVDDSANLPSDGRELSVEEEQSNGSHPAQVSPNSLLLDDDDIADTSVDPVVNGRSPVTEEVTMPVAADVPQIEDLPQAADAGEAIGRCQAELDGLLAGNRISFSPGSYELTQSSHKLLEDLAATIDGCDASIEVAGHTDASGKASRNKKLSQQRAESVVAFLVDAGVSPQRLSAVGFGEDHPIASNDTADGRRTNRRIELKARISQGDGAQQIDSGSPVALCQVELDQLMRGQRISFDPGSIRLSSDSRDVLGRIAAVASGCNTNIEVSGHTDSTGKASRNKQLSQQRADSVMSYLIEAGVPEQRLSAVGHGEASPIVSNATAFGRRANRRIEFKARAQEEPEA